jgi:hypothetical protein
MESRWRFHDHVWAKLLLKRFRRFIGNPLANLLESVRRYRKPCEKFVTGFKLQIKSSTVLAASENNKYFFEGCQYDTGIL